jgi:hypothetical protein
VCLCSFVASHKGTWLCCIDHRKQQALQQYFLALARFEVLHLMHAPPSASSCHPALAFRSVHPALAFRSGPPGTHIQFGPTRSAPPPPPRRFFSVPLLSLPSPTLSSTNAFRNTTQPSLCGGMLPLGLSTYVSSHTQTEPPIKPYLRHDLRQVVE